MVKIIKPSGINRLETLNIIQSSLIYLRYMDLSERNVCPGKLSKTCNCIRGIRRFFPQPLAIPGCRSRALRNGSEKRGPDHLDSFPGRSWYILSQPRQEVESCLYHFFSPPVPTPSRTCSSQTELFLIKFLFAIFI